MGKKRRPASAVEASVYGLFDYGRDDVGPVSDMPGMMPAVQRRQQVHEREALIQELGMRQQSRDASIRTAARQDDYDENGSTQLTYTDRESHYAEARARIFSQQGGMVRGDFAEELQQPSRPQFNETRWGDWEDEHDEYYPANSWQGLPPPRHHHERHEEEEYGRYQEGRCEEHRAPAAVYEVEANPECYVSPLPDKRTEIIPRAHGTQYRDLWEPPQAGKNGKGAKGEGRCARGRGGGGYSGRGGGSGGGRGAKGRDEGRGSGRGRGGKRSADSKATLKGQLSPDEMMEYSRDSIKFDGYVKPSLNLLNSFR